MALSPTQPLAAPRACRGSAPAGLLAAALLLALALALALGACVASPSSSSGGGTDSTILGGWTLQPDAACRESLAFLPDGHFVHGVALTLQGQSAQRLVGGTVGGLALAADGSLQADVTPQGAITDPVAYCGQWAGAGRGARPFTAIQLATGYDPAPLAWRALTLPGGALAWVGTDTTQDADRLVLARDADVLHGFTLDDAVAAGAVDSSAVLFHRRPAHLPGAYPPSTVTVVNLPQQAYSQRSDVTTADVSIVRLLLSLHSAVDVDFTPRADWTGYPLCHLVAMDSPSFNAPLSPNPLANVATTPVVTLNPGDPGQFPPLLATTVTGEPQPVYLLAVDVRTPPGGGLCQVNLRARPLAARLAAEHLQTAAAGDFTVALTGGPAFLLGVPRGQPTALRTLPLQGSTARAVTRLLDQLVQPVADGADTLGLQAGASQSVQLSVQSLGGQRYLNVFPAGSSTAGLGPFADYGEPAAPTALSVPGTAAVSLPAGAQAAYGFTLAAPALVRLYTDGGAETTGTLLDGQGTRLAAARGGAADGAGFRLVAFLPAGGYRLLVQAGAQPVTGTLHAEQPASAGPTDGTLEACLRMAGAAGALATDLRAADCAGQAIASLAGIGAYSGLQTLRLDDTSVTDLTPLTALTELAALSLGGTAPADLTPLASVPRLYRFALPRVALDPAALAALETLTRLTRLDLHGATGLSADDLTALKAALPDTTIIAPDGTVME